MAATAAVSALLLVGSVNHLSALPPGLSLPPEVLQLPFRKAQPVVTVLHGGVGTKTVVIDPDALTTTGPNEQTVVADQPPEMSATPDSAQKTIVNSNRVHSVCESEAEIVAQNTVVRYYPQSAALRVSPHKKP